MTIICLILLLEILSQCSCTGISEHDLGKRAGLYKDIKGKGKKKRRVKRSGMGNLEGDYDDEADGDYDDELYQQSSASSIEEESSEEEIIEISEPEPEEEEEEEEEEEIEEEEEEEEEEMEEEEEYYDEEVPDSREANEELLARLRA
jgi:hypothetical protein